MLADRSSLPESTFHNIKTEESTEVGQALVAIKGDIPSQDQPDKVNVLVATSLEDEPKSSRAHFHKCLECGKRLAIS